MNNRRTYEGHMDWEYQDKGPVDMSSPFAQLPQRLQSSSFESSSKFGSHRPNPNPFAAADAPKQSSSQPPSRQPYPQPPRKDIFTPQIQRQWSGSAFRNPAFTTPQKSFAADDSLLSEMSAADDSPAMTDASGFADTPDNDRQDEISRAPLAPSTANRQLFSSKKTSGKGALMRLKPDPYQRDKIRKRKRLHGDRDIGSGRSRLSHESDESESEYEGNGHSRRKMDRSRSPKEPQQSWLRNFLGTIRDHPQVPIILSWWVQMAVNVFFLAILVWVVWSFISMMRSDLASATDKARAELLAEMEACSREFLKNKCAPLAQRVPAMEALCNQWEMCMNQDPTSVMKVQVSVKNVAEIINEFFTAISWKAVGCIVTIVILMVVANNIGFSRYRQGFEQYKSAPPVPSQSANFPMLASSQRDPNQAYIWAPINTPRHIRQAFLQDEQTDTDASPEAKTLLLPRTPSRRSPSKEHRERGRSPTKGGRSTSRGY